MAPISPSSIVNMATTKPVIMPASAPQALVRFAQIDSSSTGNEVDALKVRDHRNSCSGSAGAAMASQDATNAAPSRARRAVPMRAVRDRLVGQAVNDVLGQNGADRQQGRCQCRERSRQGAGQGQIDDHLRQAGGDGQREQDGVALEAEAARRTTWALASMRAMPACCRSWNQTGKLSPGWPTTCSSTKARR